jgi:Leucine-rich repeat (LRR) protein
MSVLPFVRGVDFSRNQFKLDQFQRKMAEMSNLRWLRLNRSQLGSLPDEIDQFQKLEVLTIAHNKMTALHSGNLPALSSLRVVNVAHNNLRDSGLPSELFTLKELHTLDMSYNNLTKIPDELLKSKSLIVVDLSHNKVSTIPGALFIQLTGVEYLDLSHNELQSLPPQLRRMEHLRHLNLANNPLQHYAFKVLDKLTNLTSLNLSATGRDFTNLPHIDKLVNLTDIDLSYNDLSRIPESVYLVESLTRVNMRHNCIKELSSLIDTWHNLVTLDLSHNMITALHPNICKCSKLKRLFLSDNRLNFEGIPAGIGKLSNLVHFVAARNKLECVPEGLCHCYSLKSLVLTSNCLLTLPEAIHFLKLENLDIRDNPDLTMPPKPVQQVKGSGAEWYNIDFDPEILKKGAVVSSAQVIKGAYTRQKERREKMQKNRRTSISTLRGAARDGKDEDAAKVLKGLLDVAEATASERDHDVLAAGAGVSMTTDQDRERAPVTPKRWDAMLKRPDLDYSDLFSETTGKLPGLTVWQIENFYPVEIDESQHGQFYKADAYIILKTQWNEMSEMDWEIYFWIGEESTMDKRACAAMHSVHLRNMLGCERRTHREEMGDESDAFVDLFPEITYIEGGSHSGFFTTEEEDVVYRLYQLQGTKHPFLEPVEMEAESLNLGLVFLLDCGEVLFIWCGSRSSLMSRSKARLLAEKINKFERKGHSKIIQLRPGLEPDQFWHFLGGEPEKPIPVGPIPNIPIHIPPFSHSPVS